MAEPYNDPILRKYAELIRAEMPQFLMVYQGEPLRIPKSNVPCLILSKRETRVGPLTNSEDEHGVAITLSVVVDVRNDLSTEINDAEIVEGVNTLYDLVEGRNADYSLKDNCVLDVLRSNSLVDAANNLRTDLNTITRVDYGRTFRDRAPEEWWIEARIEFVAHFSQVR